MELREVVSIFILSITTFDFEICSSHPSQFSSAPSVPVSSLRVFSYIGLVLEKVLQMLGGVTTCRTHGEGYQSRHLYSDLNESIYFLSFPYRIT